MTTDVSTSSRIVEYNTFPLRDHELIIADPAYTGDEHDQMRGLYPPLWDSATVYAIEDERGVRAVVVTDGSSVPPELLQAEAVGAFMFIDYIGIDTGQLGVYRDEGVGAEPTSFGIFDTYRGDGQYPVAAWGKNGDVYAYAVLTDQGYYDAAWRGTR